MAAARRLPVRRPMSSSSSAYAVADVVSPRRADGLPDAAEPFDLDVLAIVRIGDFGNEPLERGPDLDGPSGVTCLRGDPGEPGERICLRRGVVAASAEVERFGEQPVGVADAALLPRHHARPRRSNGR